MAVNILDILTPAEALVAINVGSAPDGFEEMITAVSLRLDDACGPVVARAKTELHDGGWPSIKPRNKPILTVTTLTEYNGTVAQILTVETNASKPAASYLIDRPSAGSQFVRLYRRAVGADALFESGRMNVELVVSAGRFATTATVDRRFKTAAASILRRMWKREAGAWATGFDPMEPDGSPMFFNAVSHVVSEQLPNDRLLLGIA